MHKSGAPSLAAGRQIRVLLRDEGLDDEQVLEWEQEEGVEFIVGACRRTTSSSISCARCTKNGSHPSWFRLANAYAPALSARVLFQTGRRLGLSEEQVWKLLDLASGWRGPPGRLRVHPGVGGVPEAEHRDAEAPSHGQALVSPDAGSSVRTGFVGVLVRTLECLSGGSAEAAALVAMGDVRR